MENSITIFSTILGVSLVTIFAIKCIQDNIEGYSDVLPHLKNDDKGNLLNNMKYNPGAINQTLDDVNNILPTDKQLNKAQSVGFLNPNSLNNMSSAWPNSAVDQASKGYVDTGISGSALNMPVPTTASSLLPLPVPDQNLQNWSDPSCVSNALSNQQMLSAIDIIGVNTTSSTLKNSSQDLRGDPLCNPRDPVSVFNNSSISCTLNRPLTCYEGLPRPTIWSCNWNKKWFDELDEGVKLPMRQ